MIVVKQPKNMYLKYNIKIQFCGDLEPKMVNDIRFQKYVRRRRFFSVKVVFFPIFPLQKHFKINEFL